MTPQEIHQKLKEIVDDLTEIDSSETFSEMLADSSFLMDDDDMGFLVRELEQMLAAVNAFNKQNEKAQTSGA